MCSIAKWIVPAILDSITQGVTANMYGNVCVHGSLALNSKNMETVPILIDKRMANLVRPLR